jgi:hypothetical protein
MYFGTDSSWSYISANADEDPNFDHNTYERNIRDMDRMIRDALVGVGVFLFVMYASLVATNCLYASSI